MGTSEALQGDALRAFAVFARHRNFTSAAAELLISQPSLHVKINKLARTLGVPLYRRQGRGLVLTPEGRRLAALAHDVGRQVEDYLSEVSRDQAPITLAAGRGALRWVIGDAVRRLTSTRRLRLSVAAGPAAQASVLHGEADLAVVAFDPPGRELAALLLASFPQVVMVPEGHTLAGRDAVGLVDLAGEELIVPPADRQHRRGLDRALSEAGASWTVAAEVDGWDLMVHFVRLGLGLAVVNGCVEPPEGVRSVVVADLPVVRYWAAWRPERSRAVADAVDVLARS